MNVASRYLLFLALVVALAIPIANSFTDTSVDKRELALRLRLISAGWFALSACVPVCLFWLFVLKLWDSLQNARHLWPAAVWVFGGLPVSAAALCGFIRGARILDLRIVSTSFQAVRRGLVVGLLSYLIFGVGLSTLSFVYGERATRLQFLLGTLVVVAVGGIVIGWLVLLATSVSGLLLYRLSRSKRFQRQLAGSMRVSKSVALNWTVAAMVVFHICSVPGSLAFGAAVKREFRKQRNRALMTAVSYGDATSAEAWLREGADVNNTDADLPPLAAAAQSRHPNVVKVLLDHGADPNMFDPGRSYRTPLMAAVSQGDLEATQALLDHGANLNAAGQQGYTPIMDASRFGTPEVVRALLARGADIRPRNSADGKTALGLAMLTKDALKQRAEFEDCSSRESREIANAGIRSDEIVRILKAAGARE